MRGRTVATAVSIRRLSGVFFHQGPPRYQLLSCADPASVDARYQQQGEPGVWYASSRERGAWAEQFRHLLDDTVSPLEIRRRVGRVRVTDLQVLDLTDPDVQQLLGLIEADLTSDDYAVCQDVAAVARDAGFDAVLAPSAALPDLQTLAVFAGALHSGKVVAEHSRVQTPPVTLLDWLPQIRPVPQAAAAVARLFEDLLTLGKHSARRWRPHN